MKSKSIKLMSITGLALLAAQSCLVASAFADTAGHSEAAERLTRINAFNRQITASNTRVTPSRETVSESGAQAKDLVANPARDYPPSCLNDGLPFKSHVTGDPIGTATIRLLGDPADCASSSPTAECSYEEDVQVSIWRVACSSGTSATVMEIDRPLSMDGNRTLYPTMPGVTLQQGSNTVFARLAEDENTKYTAVAANAPIFFSTIFVVENFYSNVVGGIGVNMNSPFTLTVDSFRGGASRYTSFSFPAYNPAAYAYGLQPLPITGYMSSNWYDPAHDNEGILTQIFEIPSDANHRVFTFAWYTYDPIGIPFWLFGNGLIDTDPTHAGSRTVTIPTYYFGNGGFAGAFGSRANTYGWGNVQFSFPDCGHMTFSYNGGNVGGSTFTPPTGTGTRHWLRIANINSLTCE